MKLNNNLEIIEDFIPVGKLRKGTKYTKTSITIHSTGNPKSTAKNELGWLNNSNNTRIASWHYVVDEKEIYNAIPAGEIAYHAAKGSGNCYSIGIEICESGDRLKTLENTIILVKYLMEKYNIEEIKTHQDWSGKNCPRILIDKDFIKDNLNWSWFISQIRKEIKEEEQFMDWKEKIVAEAVKIGLITKDQWEDKAGEQASVWFVLQVALNVIKILKK